MEADKKQQQTWCSKDGILNFGYNAIKCQILTTNKCKLI